MKYHNYFLCSHQQCLQNGNFIFRGEQAHPHKNHQYVNAQLDDVYNTYKQMIQERQKMYLQGSRKQIIEEMEKVITKIFQKSSKCLTILKNQSFAPKSPLSFTYQQISSFYFKNKRPLELSIQKTYEQISLQYRPIFNRWRQQLNKLQQFIQCSVVNHQISPEIKLEPITQIQTSPVEQIEEEIVEVDQNQKMEKSKKIKKMENKIKFLMQRKRQKMQDQIQFSFEQQQSLINEDSQNQQQILYLQNSSQIHRIPKSQKLRGIVINSNNIRQYKLTQILKKTEQVKQITFNINYKINRYFYVQCFKKIAAQLTHLYQLWNQDKKFRERQACTYFPKQPFNQNRIQRSHIELSLWKKFNRLRTLWIANSADFYNAKSADNPFKDLEYLNIQPCSCCPSDNFNSVEILNKFGSNHQLQVLILRNLPFYQFLTHTIIECLNKNKSIRVFIMNSVKLQQKLINRLSLVNLTNLCLKSTCIYGSQQLNILPIFKLSQLKYLSLVSIIFSKDRANAKSTLCNLGNLSHLTYLNLYHSYPIYSQILSYLHPNSAQCLKTLNLGQTHIDNSCIHKLIQLQNLQELNLDSTQIQIQKISEICQEPCLKLKSISLLGCNKQIVKQLQFIPERAKALVSITTMTHLNNIYPNLSYVNVARCNLDIAFFNWKTMKSLQFLTFQKDIMNKKYMKSIGIQVFEI